MSGSSPTSERTRTGEPLPSLVDEDVVEELVGVVPQRHSLGAEGLHRLGDREEVLEEGRRQAVPRPVDPAELERDPQHLQAGERHPARRVGLLEPPPVRHLARPVEDADVVHPEEAALEEVGPVGVLAVEPPREVEEQLGEDADEEAVVPRAVEDVDVPRGPGVHGRVDVTELPFVCRQLAVGVLAPLPAHEHELVLGELRVHVRDRDGVEGEVPGGEPGVLPLVGHRDDVGEGEVRPGGVARPRLTGQPRVRRRRSRPGRPRATRARRSGRAACTS